MFVTTGQVINIHVQFFAAPSSVLLVFTMQCAKKPNPTSSTLQEWYNKFVSLPTEKATFVRVTDKVAVCSMRKRNFEKYGACDQLAVAIAIDDKVAIQAPSHYVTVELHGEFTRGQMIVDKEGKMNKSPNAVIVTTVDMELYKKYMYQAVDCTNGDST